MPSANRDFLLEGACRAVAHGVELVRDAKTLLGEGRCSSSYLLSVMAREELGRANILWHRAIEMKAEGGLSEEQIASLRKELNNHLNKIDRGQSTTHYTLPLALMAKYKLALESNDQPALAEFHADRKRIAKEVRDGDPKRTHLRRMDAQYVSLRDGLAWSNPADIKFEETRNLLVDVAHEIGGTLMQAETDDTMTSICARCGISLPRSRDFDSTVSERIFLMQPVE